MAEEPNSEAMPAVAAAAEAENKDDRKQGVTRETAHAAADIEADAVAARAKAEKEAEEIADVAGIRAGQKFLEKRIAEIEAAANERMEGLKKWLDDRLNQIEGKRRREEKPAEEEHEPPAAAPAAEPPAAAPPPEAAAPPPEKRRPRRYAI